jgi:hypothetical protein
MTGIERARAGAAIVFDLNGEDADFIGKPTGGTHTHGEISTPGTDPAPIVSRIVHVTADAGQYPGVDAGETVFRVEAEPFDGLDFPRRMRRAGGDIEEIEMAHPLRVNGIPAQYVVKLRKVNPGSP